MTKQELINYFSINLKSINFETTDWNTYRKFIHVVYTSTPQRASIRFQRNLERNRPTLDYIILADGSLLIGAQEDWEDLKKSATELMMKGLSDLKQKELKYMQQMISTLQFHHNRDTYEVYFPEEFV